MFYFVPWDSSPLNHQIWENICLDFSILLCFPFESSPIIAMIPEESPDTTSTLPDLSVIPRPSLQPRVNVVLQCNWLAVAAKFLEHLSQESDVRDLVLAVFTSELELSFLEDLIKRNLSNFIWLHYQQSLRKTRESIPLNYHVYTWPFW